MDKDGYFTELRIKESKVDTVSMFADALYNWLKVVKSLLYWNIRELNNFSLFTFMFIISVYNDLSKEYSKNNLYILQTFIYISKKITTPPLKL